MSCLPSQNHSKSYLSINKKSEGQVSDRMPHELCGKSQTVHGDSQNHSKSYLSTNKKSEGQVSTVCHMNFVVSPKLSMGIPKFGVQLLEIPNLAHTSLLLAFRMKQTVTCLDGISRNAPFIKSFDVLFSSFRPSVVRSSSSSKARSSYNETS